ncbi:MAG: hypothetical protein ACKVS8_06420 [Phycisphaerales bacterium]
MPIWRNAARALHTAALGVWLGVVVMTAAAAAIIFPTVKALAPTLPAFSAYTGDHWMVAAGKVADRIFAISDAAQFACAILAGAGLVLARPMGHASWRTLRTALRITALSAAITALAYQLFVLSPRMSQNLKGYWAAAERGDNTAAASLRAAFNADHPTATIVLGVLAVIVLACLPLAAWPETEPASPRGPT